MQFNTLLYALAVEKESATGHKLLEYAEITNNFYINPLQKYLPAPASSPAFAIAEHISYTNQLQRHACAILPTGFTSLLWTQSCKKP